MPTAIAVTSADLVLPAPDRHTPPAAVLHPPDGQDLERTLADTTALLDRHGHLLVLLPDWLPAPTARRLHTVRALLESDRIALLPVDLPPLGTALLARQLSQLTVCDFSPGVIASAARLLSHYIYAGAVLGTVARLDRVPVDLKAHARSWSPSAQFSVLANPTPHLARLGPTAEPPPGPGFGTHLAFARGKLAGDWPAAELGPAWQVQGVMEHPLPAGSPAWWGTPKLIEFAAAIPDIGVLYQLVASVRREECRWCGLELIGDRCGFCATPIPSAAASPSPAASPSGAPSAAARP